MVNLVQSRDGYVRSAKVSMPSGRIIGRPINLLFPIEVSENSKEYPVKDEKRSSRHFLSTSHPNASYQVSSQLAFQFRRRSEK